MVRPRAKVTQIRSDIGLLRVDKRNSTIHTGWAKLSDTTLHFCL